jgi:hypothetical protein
VPGAGVQAIPRNGNPHTASSPAPLTPGPSRVGVCSGCISFLAQVPFGWSLLQEVAMSDQGFVQFAVMLAALGLMLVQALVG